MGVVGAGETGAGAAALSPKYCNSTGNSTPTSVNSLPGEIALFMSPAQDEKIENKMIYIRL
jgi:hypothetical protein